MVDLSYHRNYESPEYYKLRPIIQRPNGHNTMGVGLPAEKVKHLSGTWFKAEVIGTTIILYSGCRT